MKNYKEILDSVPIGQIYKYLTNIQNLAREKRVKEYANNFCFILNDGSEYDDDESIVYITSKEFFDKNGYLEDCSYTEEFDDKSPYLILPDFLEEVSESTYTSEYSLEETRQKLIDFGFEERFFNNDTTHILH